VPQPVPNLRGISLAANPHVFNAHFTLFDLPKGTQGPFLLLSALRTVWNL
jgi:hypothetical protein